MAETAGEVGDIEPVEVFFDDLDAFGMVYHGRFAALVEHGITFYTARRMGLTLGHEDANVLVREVKITYEQPLMRIGTVDMAIWVQAVGVTSARFGFRFETGAEIVHAHGHREVVKLDPVTHRPAPWTERTRRLLQDKLIAPGKGASAA